MYSNNNSAYVTMIQYQSFYLGYADMHYYKGESTNLHNIICTGNYISELIFDLDTNKEAATRDEGATLNCRASIEFPPFSMLSLIKNGRMVSSSTNGSLYR